MFSQRRNSQKPGEELYAAFKQSFPEVGPGTSSALLGPCQQPSALSQALITTASIQRDYDDNDNEHSKRQNATSKPACENWRLTPSLMDPNSFSSSSIANQPPGYYTPTPSGLNTLYHSQAGDLHTPGMGMNTPLSLPHSGHSLHAPDPAMHFQHFSPHMPQHPHAFHELFALQQQQQQQHHHHHHNLHHHQQHPRSQSQAFLPQQFLQHPDSGYEVVDSTPNKAISMQQEIGPQTSAIHPSLSHGVQSSPHIPGMPPGEKFRFHTTLNAPTAMVKHADEIPITYLNKGQAYTLSIFDTSPPMPQPNVPVKYRTYVRVSFEDEQQRARPGQCWQLWKEGRGSNEAHQRGGKLLAVEYVYPSQGCEDGPRKSRIELEQAAFDGFAVTWYPNQIAGVPDCSIAVRFNFLSTDFSHSKGVKGIPVRLCAKTEMLTPLDSAKNEPEVCFSKVKLFRDHGAERKLSNDVSHVKKTIEKLKQHIAQAESGIGSAGKRKRSSSSIAKAGISKPGKVIKHKRTWSVDADVEGGVRPAGEEDLHMKLATMQDMFSSTRPVSVLFLKGDSDDDPDLHPVKLPGGDSVEPNSLNRSNMWESRLSNSGSPTSNPASPTSSSSSQPTPKRKLVDMHQPAIAEQGPEELSATPTIDKAESPRPVKIMRLESEMKPQSDILVFDVDTSYQPPLERPVKPVACFYVRRKDESTEYYRAVYLMQRTVQDLISGISQKFQIDPIRVAQVTHVNTKGLHIVVDEDVVREVPEGQDMLVEFAPAQTDGQVKQEFATPVTSEVLADGILDPSEFSAYDPLEMWLDY